MVISKQATFPQATSPPRNAAAERREKQGAFKTWRSFARDVRKKRQKKKKVDADPSATLIASPERAAHHASAS
eukprot:3565042-Prymnesium_polylepis.2